VGEWRGKRKKQEKQRGRDAKEMRKNSKREEA
jgi:hypothetical protein